MYLTAQAPVVFLLLSFEELLHFLSFSSPRKRPSVAICKMPTHSFPRKGKNPQFHGICRAVCILVRRWSSVAVPHVGVLIWGSQKGLHSDSKSHLHREEVDRQIVWRKQREHSGQSFPEESVLNHQQLNGIEFPSTP